MDRRSDACTKSHRVCRLVILINHDAVRSERQWGEKEGGEIEEEKGNEKEIRVRILFAGKRRHRKKRERASISNTVTENTVHV